MLTLFSKNEIQLRLSLVFASILLSGCTSLNSRELPEYKLNKTASYFVSESPELWKNYLRLENKNTIPSAEFIIQNISDQKRILHLARSTAFVNNKPYPLECSDLSNNSMQIELASLSSSKISCVLKITLDQLNLAKSQTYIVKLAIPTDAEAVELERVIFTRDR